MTLLPDTSPNSAASSLRKGITVSRRNLHFGQRCGGPRHSFESGAYGRRFAEARHRGGIRRLVRRFMLVLSGGQYPAGSTKLMKVTKECLDLGIARALPGGRLGDITSAIQQHAESNGYSVVRDLLAHGIGRSLRAELRAYRRSRQRHSIKGRYGVYD